MLRRRELQIDLAQAQIDQRTAAERAFLG
jgi:hypothetical protein